MENFDPTRMQEIAEYAPVRIALLGLARTIFGLLICAIGAAAIWSAAAGEMKPAHPGAPARVVDGPGRRCIRLRRSSTDTCPRPGTIQRKLLAIQTTIGR